ncbi:Clp protease N-terminal domain-containing protein [Trujillonella endophytica]|uniref:Clp amino terminal domain-containing protein, pathogenicity island component n=1 Tax=Trujillonella endophytica TaxID=673521 RepID=A0A1H8SCA1_9ACTN|nr:Clp protease N-terminal domain-containing protein [Trujillella endophytica]SEO75888.1 Clp amino terminal domain-containing protein, pathogenicity island component [Trujillella endophytica]
MGLVRAIRDIRTIKRLLTGAEAEARSAGEAVPGPEHLLLSAAALPDGSAARALARLGTDAAALRSAVAATHAEALTDLGLEAGTAPAPALATPAAGPMRTSPQAQQVFQRAVELSKRASPAGLRGVHVLAAVGELERGTAVRALRRLGVEPGQVTAAARAEEDVLA